MGRPLRAAVVAVAGLLWAGACSHYSTTAQFGTNLRTVNIATFANRTSEFLLPQRLAEGITQRFLEQGTLRMASPEEADAILTGTILDYREEPLAYVGQGSVTQRRVRIQVQAELRERAKDRVLWRADQLERWATYDTATQREADAQAEAVRRLAEDMVAQALQGW